MSIKKVRKSVMDKLRIRFYETGKEEDFLKLRKAEAAYSKTLRGKIKIT